MLSEQTLFCFGVGSLAFQQSINIQIFTSYTYMILTLCIL